MATRKRVSSLSVSSKPDPLEPKSAPSEQKMTRNTVAASGEEFCLAKPKLGVIFVISTLLCSFYRYLLCFHYTFDYELKRSILINVGLSLVGFFVTLKMIPLAARYVLRRNMFG